jgi:hypothetical protein
MKALRLASARRKLRAFVEQIEIVEASDFPHHDGQAALALVKKKAVDLKRQLDRLPDNAQGANSACDSVRLTVRLYTEVLGFILRSTNVRNAFEVHFPLKRLIETAIGKRARLIMSSEWKFVPFTYPMTLDILPDYVLVGGPASEADNALIVPLAGHEIGHSAWRHHNIRGEILVETVSAVSSAIAGSPLQRDHLLRLGWGPGGDLSVIQQMALKFALKQLEELFCDIFGLYVFGPSYLYAYEYFLAPGGGPRSHTYPSSLARVQYNLRAAQELGVAFEADLFEEWEDSLSTVGADTSILVIADKAVELVFPSLLAKTKSLLKRRRIRQPREAQIEAVGAALSRQVPYGEGAYLSEIVTAGWRRLRAKGGFGLNDEAPEFKALNELMLKSVEVSEFLLRAAKDA